MKICKKALLHNKFEVKVVDSRTGELKQEAVGYNVITNDFFKFRLRTESTPSTNSKLTAIGVGSGTGTPSITDTALFQPLLHRTATDVDATYAYPTSSITKQIVINADEYNGSTITEVGLEFAVTGIFGGTAYYLATHAMLQDSEGNQIAIEKTDVDVVYINATFYVTFSTTGFGEKGIYALPEKNTLIQWVVNGTTSLSLAASRFKMEHSSDLTTDYHFLKNYSFLDGTGNYETLTWDLPVMTLLDSEYNGHVVKTVGIPTIGAYSFPDASIFSDYPVNHLVVGEGDGVTTEFNIQCPLIKAGSAQVFVGGNPLAASEFEVDYESNCTDCRENYYTTQMTCQAETVKFGDLKNRGASSSWYSDPLFWGIFPREKQLYNSYCYVKETDPIWIDFGTPKACNSLRVDTRNIGAAVDKMVIEYSDDNENWTPVEYTLTEEPLNTTYTFYKWKWPIVSARYWRVYIKGSTWSYYLESNNNLGTRDNTSNVRGTFFLGKSVPGLKLKTPPAPGETVEVSYKLDVPFKTANNLIRMTCSIVLQRG